jgi:hypothetical protein
MNTAKRLLASLYSVPDRVLDRIRPPKPYDFLKAQPASFAETLPYEGMLSVSTPRGNGEACLLTDGSMGILWELSPLPHEVLTQTEIERRSRALAEVFEKIRDPRVTFQIIYDVTPAPAIPRPLYLQDPKTAPELMLAARIESVESLAYAPKDHLRLMERRVFLTLRLARAQTSVPHLWENEREAVLAHFASQKSELERLWAEVEYSLAHGDIPYRPLSGKDLLALLRGTFHDLSSLRGAAVLKPEEPLQNVPLSDQVLRDFVRISPESINVGEDRWAVASWLDQPPTIHAGLCSGFMELDFAHRVVVNIRPCQDVSDLTTKSALLKKASDAFGELQRDEIRGTQDALARGDQLLFVSIHLLIRTEGKDIQNSWDDAKDFVSRVKTLTQIPFMLERYAAPAIFLFSLPLGFGPTSGRFTGREKRVLARNIAPYLPIFGSFRGTKTPLQLMVARGGEPAWINPFDSETSPHMAVLASSGGGKSFFAQNLMTSFFAKEGRTSHGETKGPLLFILDKKTSYEIFARVIGEEFGSQIIKPPSEYPNIFRGALDEFRLPVMVGILKTAVSLVSKDARFEAREEMLVADGIRFAFEQAELESRTAYSPEGLMDQSPGLMKIPRLSDVVENLFPVAARANIPPSAAEALAQEFAPFLGQGPYAALFDREDWDYYDPKTPGISLYDLDAVSSHPVLATLATQMILSEILRQIRRPENRGRPGMLVIEEAGVLAGASPVTVSFIQDAWKTFRKLGIACVGLTNEVDDFAERPGPREMWNVSPNKVILRMLDKDIQKALSGNPDQGYPPLISDHHLGSLIQSLTKRDGHYSQGLWWSDETRGTFVFRPTGYDYWCAASKPIEVETVHDVARCFAVESRPYFAAVRWLAERFPRGVRALDGTIRHLNKAELPREADVLPAREGEAL